MRAYIFPGQGSQFVGMGKELYERSTTARDLFEQANAILGFNISEILFRGTTESLQQTDVTQPAVFLHSVILAKELGDQFQPELVAGHSLGEFSALVTIGALSFEAGLRLVLARARAMQKACMSRHSAMAAILGLDDAIVETICAELSEIVVPANYNCPGQLVISGTIAGIDQACALLSKAGAKRTLKLAVGGAFHSPLMEPARAALQIAIETTPFHQPICPIYQNIDAQAYTDIPSIKKNLIAQLTGAVRWSQSIQNMVNQGASSFTEVGPGTVLQGLVKKINSTVKIFSA